MKWWKIFYWNWCSKYPEKLHDFHNDLPFLPVQMKFEKVDEIFSTHKKLITSI